MTKWSIITRIGGKYSVRKEIQEFFPSSYDTFIEAFVGGGQVLLELLQNFYNPNVKYVINDKNNDIYNIWRDMKVVPKEKL
jgi:site-specific DNA-adenine methylase